MENTDISLKDASLSYYSAFIPEVEADTLLHRLLHETEWSQDTIKLFGKEVLQPRLTAFFGESGLDYTYSGLTMKPKPFPGFIIKLKQECEKIARTDFNVCLVNLYRDGKDSMGWHADDEKELGPNPVIASVSLGAERFFKLKHKKDLTAGYKIRLQHGSLLIMSGTTQEFWKHSLPKTAKTVNPRINLTFRKIV
ncbi:alpha-ketoglutarate-dependent dioxygenase AlkB [Gramella sp. GC03-9]|uniref:Alpha-ketoglutarate-dependent dioxygenase AlkB n=1 Tax=Christiangramia oceanisediminis TaxID=2920386 RepID=A0A9X2RE80_9FLAO|nr:alpha-ketoglutarate-dependent dioxygenase AlkB [Gramella oceanisediminis]MCP9201146.1 alpha-ketoglutarate-dependent dioxygenase AlkB [Gramella oceanisediminis]